MCCEATDTLNNMYRRLGTWRSVANEIGDVSPALCWKVAQGAHSPTVNRALGIRTTYTRTLAFRLDPAEFERIRAIVDAHPGGRVGWLREQAEWVDCFEEVATEEG